MLPRPSTIKRDWFVVDAAGMTLGRLATEIALRLRGKHKPEYTPFMDTGDYIIVINASKVRLPAIRLLIRCTIITPASLGGIKSESFEKLIARKA